MSTIAQVARSAGVSTATVSRVINDPSLVRPDTVKRVQSAMRKLDYTPQPPAKRRGPKAHLHFPLQHKTVALVWTRGVEPSSTITGQRMQEAAAKALQRHRISLITTFLDAGDELPDAIVAGRVDGLLLVGPEPEPEVAETLRALPSVWLLYNGSRAWGDRVQPDHRGIGRQSTDYLVAAGSRHPVCITNCSRPDRNDYYAERADAFRQFAVMHGLDPVLIGTSTPYAPDEAGKAQQACDMVAEALAQRPRVDGVFVANGLGHYVHGELLRSGIRPMQDIPLVAGDAEAVARHLDPPPVTIDIHSSVLGRLAVELLLTRLSHPKAPRVRQLVCADLAIP